MERYRLIDVVRRYREARTGRLVEALRVPRLEVRPGEVLAVVGHNGSGKSTLLETMAFLHRPDEGRILLDGHDVWAGHAPLKARRRCPLLLQRPALLRGNVLRNVMYALRLRGMSRRDARRRAEDTIRLVRLDHLARRGPRELSGGERQRVALAQLLAVEPEVLLLDEPTAHVDRDNAHLLEDIIRELHARTDLTVILASHDSRQAMALADRIVTLVGGRLLPVPVDNLFTGTLTSTAAGSYCFHGDNGLQLPLPAGVIVDDPISSAKALPPSTAPLQIAIATARVRVAPHELAPTSDTSPNLPGHIESVRRFHDACRLRIRLATSHRIRAEMPLADYTQANLNLGAPVTINLADQSVWLLPPT